MVPPPEPARSIAYGLVAAGPCADCGRPTNHAGHQRWYETAGRVRCVPCQDAASPVGRLRQRAADFEAERDRLRSALTDLRAAMTTSTHPVNRPEWHTGWTRAPAAWIDLVDAALTVQEAPDADPI